MPASLLRLLPDADATTTKSNSLYPILLCGIGSSALAYWITHSSISSLDTSGIIHPTVQHLNRLIPVSLLSVAVFMLFRVPRSLAHLPRVPILPLLLSYARSEPEASRLERLVLPFANEHGAGVVVIWALGRWMVHILDPQLGKAVSDDVISFTKQPPPDDLLLWRLIGVRNVLMLNGDPWKRHSHIVRSALEGTVRVGHLASLAARTFKQFGEGGRIKIEEWTQRFALDAVGTTSFGHDFNAIEEHSSPFVLQYNSIMSAIANPVYLVFPVLEKWIPRKRITSQIDGLVSLFQHMLDEKRLGDKGADVLSFMLEQEQAGEMSSEEIRDNMVVFFIAGHDTTAGSLSSWCYYMAKYPEYQARARAEVLSILGESCTAHEDITALDLQRMPFLNATIREALRINTPITYTVPRSCGQAVMLGEYYIPPDTSLILNQFVVHHREESWKDAFVFNPDRFEQVEDSNTWIPFSTGPRQCPARNFALYELRVFSALLLPEFEWTLPEDSIHKGKLLNAFSPFALSLPYNLELNFKKYA